MGAKPRTPEQKIAAIAGVAHGVVTRADLLRAGLTRKEIEHRLASGALTREYRGVFRVGHRAPSIEAGYLAAVRACGGNALLYGRAAARLLGLIKRGAPPPEVIAPTERAVPGVRTHRSRGLDARDGMVWNGIPVTTVPRTLVDIAGELPEDELAVVCHQAGVRFRATPRQVASLLARRPRTPGAAKLRRIISGDSPILLSKLEKRFRKLLRQAALPLPKTNRRTGGYYVDCRWPQYRLTVELDSYRFHNSRHSWQRDHHRARQAYARGDEFRRYAWGDVYEEPELMLRELHGLLSVERPSRPSGPSARP